MESTNCSHEFSVTVCLPGRGRFNGGTYDIYRTFKDERKARDYYTDMLLRYPNREVTLNKK